MSAWFAYCYPKVLLNERWLRKVSRANLFFRKLGAILYLNVLFVDLYKYIFILFGMRFTGG
jgi:hypothetical protein